MTPVHVRFGAWGQHETLGHEYGDSRHDRARGERPQDGRVTSHCRRHHTGTSVLAPVNTWQGSSRFT
jgi:hypothetical protein